MTDATLDVRQLAELLHLNRRTVTNYAISTPASFFIETHYIGFYSWLSTHYLVSWKREAQFSSCGRAGTRTRSTHLRQNHIEWTGRPLNLNL